MVNMVECRLNGRWPLIVPDFRAEFWNARPDWHRGLLDSCAELMEPGMMVYDIGAEHGDLTCAYRTFVGDTGDVIPVEPAAWYWPFIRSTWGANGFGAPPAAMFCGLAADRPEGFAGGLHLGTGGWCPDSEGEGIPDGGFVHLNHRPRTGCPVMTIDSLAPYAKPDVVVVDCEGAEHAILLGASSTLEVHRPIIFVSVHDVGDGDGWNGPLLDWYGKTVEDIHRLMETFEYDRRELPWYGEGEHQWLYTPR